MAVNKDNNGVWHYHFTYTDSRGKTHRIHRQSKDWKLKRDAVVAMELHKLKIDQSIDNITYGQLYELYLESHQEKVKSSTLDTIKFYQSTHILPAFKNKRMSEITPLMVKKWQSELLNVSGLKNSTMNVVQSQLKSVIRFGLKYDFIKLNPFKFENIKNPNEKKTEMSYWTKEEFERFIKVVADTKYQVMFTLLYWSGMRIGEALALQWNDYDGKSILVRKNYDSKNKIVTTPKTHNSYRKIALTTNVIHLLNSFKMEFVNAYEFSDECYMFGFDEPITANAVRQAFYTAIGKSEVKQIRLHDLRHSHVSLLINLGFDRFEISKRLGNKPDMIDNVYSHWFESAQLEMVDKLNKIQEIAPKLHGEEINIKKTH